MTFWKKIGYIFLWIFAAIGLFMVLGYFAIRLGLTNVKGIVDKDSRVLEEQKKEAWSDSEEWQTLEKAIVSDKKDIDRASVATGIPSRLIVAQLVVEQLRLFSTDREVYKEVFKPLQILGVQSQFSWGVMGLKQETAIEIEENLKDPASPYYLGPQFEHVLDFTSEDHDNERFERLTASHDHYYSYLYSALFLKQIETQWKNAGFGIDKRPEILSTLFNIGFEHSKPNADPQVGGAEIDLNGGVYSFGGLAGEFYDSDKLIAEFPRDY